MALHPSGRVFTVTAAASQQAADDAARKLLYLVLRRVSNDWQNVQRESTAAMAPFAIMFGDRFSVY